MRALVVAILLLSTLPLLAARSGVGAGPVTVGATGGFAGEPQIAVGRDGTVLVSATNPLYVSVDGGASFYDAMNEDVSLSSSSDSSVAMDPAGRIYYAVDWPGPGSTEVCSSDDHGHRWSCNPFAMAGVTDRMWIAAPDASVTYLVTNVGAYQTTLLASADGGVTWSTVATGFKVLDPATGPLAFQRSPGAPALPVQPYNHVGSYIGVFDYAEGGSLVLPHATPLPPSNAIPSAQFDAAGALYIASEENVGAGTGLVVGRSPDRGASWTVDHVPTPGIATVTFESVAAGSPGHVGVVFYGSALAGDPKNIAADAPWDAWWAESWDADAASPTWTLTRLDPGVHAGPICACTSTSTSGSAHFAYDFISATIDANDDAHAAWVRQPPPYSVLNTEIRYARPSSVAPTVVIAPREDASMDQTQAYGGPVLGPECATATTLCVSFPIPPNASSLHLSVRDDAALHTHVHWCFETCPGYATGGFCDEATIVIPAAARRLLVLADPKDPDVCGTNLALRPLRGVVRATFDPAPTPISGTLYLRSTAGAREADAPLRFDDLSAQAPTGSVPRIASLGGFYPSQGYQHLVLNGSWGLAAPPGGYHLAGDVEVHLFASAEAQPTAVSFDGPTVAAFSTVRVSIYDGSSSAPPLDLARPLATKNATLALGATPQEYVVDLGPVDATLRNGLTLLITEAKGLDAQIFYDAASAPSRIVIE